MHIRNIKLRYVRRFRAMDIGRLPQYVMLVKATYLFPLAVRLLATSARAVLRLHLLYVLALDVPCM